MVAEEQEIRRAACFHFQDTWARIGIELPCPFSLWRSRLLQTVGIGRSVTQAEAVFAVGLYPGNHRVAQVFFGEAQGGHTGFAGWHSAEITDQAHEQVVEQLYLITVGARRDMVASNAAVVGDEGIGSVRCQGQAAHEVFGRFVDAAGGEGNNADAHRRCLGGGKLHPAHTA